MLEKLKIMLCFEDSTQDEKLMLILDSVESRLRLLLGGADPPDEMEHIIIEVAIIRFNRIGSEGLASHNVEGETQSYASANDFAPFMVSSGIFRNAKRCKTRKVEVSRRYDTTVYFQKLMQGEYDPETGDYKEDSIREDAKQAAVMDTSTQMMQLIYGTIKQGSLTVQLQNH